MRKVLEAAAVKTGVDIKKGVYMWFSGPSFIRWLNFGTARVVGADAVGMSTVPEVIGAVPHT